MNNDLTESQRLFVNENGQVQHPILSEEEWKPTLQLNIIIMALEFELAHILSEYSISQEKVFGANSINLSKMHN